ncbi:MAG: hypothetical protein AB7R89_27790 [Dehalococcoidia bacterium]
MIAQQLDCQLYESSGTFLANGTCELSGPLAPGTSVVMAVQVPGRVISRSLLGPVRRVRIKVGGGSPLPAHVERIFFDPKRGRALQLRVDSA